MCIYTFFNAIVLNVFLRQNLDKVKNIQKKKFFYIALIRSSVCIKKMDGVIAMSMVAL